MVARGERLETLKQLHTTSDVPRGDDVNTITLRHRVHWTGFMEPGEDREVIGPEFAEALEEGDEFSVQVGTNRWSNWTTNLEEFEWSSGAAQTYTRTIGEDPPSRFEVRREDYRSGGRDSPLGFDAPLLLAVLATAGILARSN